MKITVLGSGSQGNSTLIEIGNKKLLIDVGFSYKHMKEKLNEVHVDPKEIDAVLITHEHNDHIRGLKVFINKENPKVYIKEQLINPYLNVKTKENIIPLQNEQQIEDINIKILPTSHDVIDPVGFLIEHKKETLVYITDTGYIHHKVLAQIKNKTYYILESNHDTEMLINGPYPIYLQHRILSDKGHLSNDFCAAYLSKIIGPNTKEVILAHLSEKNNTPDIALETVTKILKENNVDFNNIRCASEYEMVKII